MRLDLALVQRRGTLSAIILEQSLSGPRIREVARQDMINGDPLPTLARLRSDCERLGCAAAWRGKVFLCLGAENGVFHDFTLPTANSRAAAKSLPLLLESELPFNPEDFAWKADFHKISGKKQMDAIITLIPRKTLALWENALSELGLSDIIIFLSPWPLLTCLPNLRHAALFVGIFQDNGIICAFNDKGQVIRIQQFFLDKNQKNDSIALEIHRKSLLLLNGLAYTPKRLLLYAPDQNIRGEIEEKFSLPVVMPGEDFPLAGRFTLLDENDPARMAAIAMARQNIFSRFRAPEFKFQAKKSTISLSDKKIWIGATAIIILFLGMGATMFLETLKIKTEAEQLRALMNRELKKALPDAPRNAAAGRLRAILNSRVKELENNKSPFSSQIVLKILEEIHARVPASLNIDVHRFGMDDSHLRIYGRAGNYEEVNAMKEALEKVEGLSGARIVNAATRSDRDRGARPYVEFELDLAREKK